MKRFLLAACAAAFAPAVAPAAVVVDSFNITTQVAFDPALAGVAGPTTEMAAPDALGGTRFLMVDRTSADVTGQVFGAVNPDTNGGEFNFSANSGTDGRFVLNYDGTADGTASNSGLGGVDLTEGGANDRFRFDASATFGVDLLVQIFTAMGDFEATLPIPGTGSPVLLPYFLSFAAFGSDADFTAVDAVRITGTDTDLGANFRLGAVTAVGGGALIGAPVPEPASLGLFALLATGMTGGAAARRRRGAVV